MDQETLTNESSSTLQSLRQPGSLPSEIFTEILLLTLSPIWEPQEPQLKVLSLVCRFWHLITNSTPVVWSRITMIDKISHVRKALSKSGEHPIDVWGDGLPADDWCCHNDQTGSTMFIAKVQPHAQRWRHARLRLPPPEGSSPTFASLPSLQTLELCSWSSHVMSEELLALLNRQHVPFLSELSLHGPRIARWDLISLPPTISKLEISRIVRNYPFIVGWLSIIAACPNLAVFRLSSISTSPGDGVKGDERCIAPAVVELKALRELCLDQVRPELIIDLLKRLRLPEACAISIRCTVQSLNPSITFLSPALSNQRNFQRAGKVVQATVGLTDSIKNVLVVYQLWRINLNLPGALSIRNALGWFGIRSGDSNPFLLQLGRLRADVATSNSPPVTLKLGLNWLRHNFTELGAISDLRNINKIEMDSLSDEERGAFLLYLSAPQDPNQPTGTMADFLETPEPKSNQDVAGVWPFPGLSELVRRESKDDVVHRVLVEPITGQCSENAAAGTAGRATRSELREPNTPWEKVV